MGAEDFVFPINTLAGCKYPILKELEKKYLVEKPYRKKYRRTKRLSRLITWLSYFDDLRYRSLSRDLEINKPPVYVLGHWRSGTTLLNRMLCCFRDISYPTTYQTVFPNNLFFMKGLMKRIMRIYLPEKRLVDRVKMSVDLPQEEDFALGNETGFSFYYWFYFPKDHHRITDEFLSPGGEDRLKRVEYKRKYEQFVKRCILNIGGELYIAKNPPNMGRIPLLTEMFPGCRFVYIQRNPYEVLMSTFRFHRSFLTSLQLQDITDEALWNFIFHTYVVLHKKYRQDRHTIPPQNLFEITYEDLIADPGSIFRALHQGLFSDLVVNETKLGSVIRDHRNHSPNRYTFERKYIDRVNAKLGDIIEEQGYRVL